MRKLKEITLELREPIEFNDAIEFMKNEIILNNFQGLPIAIHSKRTAVSKEKLIEKIKDYCDDKIHTNDQKIKLIKKLGRKNLLYSLMLTSLLIIIGLIVYEFLPLSNLILQILLIAVWVVIWQPIQQIFYDWRDLAEDNKSYQILAQITEANLTIN